MPGTDSAASGLRSILIATAVAGMLGYAIQLLAPALLGDDATYVAFSVFWSTLYLGIAAMSGVQQEISRATHPAIAQPANTELRTFVLWGAGAMVVVSVLVALLFGNAIMSGPVPTLATVLAVGLVGYLANAVLSGVLYGLRLWPAIAGIMIIDAVLRAALVIAGFALQLPTAALALLVALPFGLSFAITWLSVRRRVIGSFSLDVPLRRLVGHSAGTVGAATASAVMITGLPMLIGLTSAGDSTATVGSLILAITVTRAPIVVPVIALQSFLISAVFRGGRVRPRRLLGFLGIGLAVVAVLAAIGWLIGPPLIAWVSAGQFSIDGWVAAVIVASAGLVAAMCVTGPALITARRHVANVVGWWTAAGLTVAALLLPLPLTEGVALALVIPPMVGLAIHAACLLGGPKSSSWSPDAPG